MPVLQYRPGKTVKNNKPNSLGEINTPEPMRLAQAQPSKWSKHCERDRPVREAQGKAATVAVEPRGTAHLAIPLHWQGPITRVHTPARPTHVLRRSRWSVYSRDMAGQGRGIARCAVLRGLFATVSALPCLVPPGQDGRSHRCEFHLLGWAFAKVTWLRCLPEVGLSQGLQLTLVWRRLQPLASKPTTSWPWAATKVTGSLFDTGDSCHRGAELAAGSPGPGSAGRSRQDRLSGRQREILDKRKK